MKATKRILAIMMCLCMVLCSFASVALAEEPTGSITIEAHDSTNATVAGKSFEVYKIFDATSDGTNTSYSWIVSGGQKLYYNFFFNADRLGENDDGDITEAVNYMVNYKKDYGDLAFSKLATELYEYAANPANGITKPTPNVAGPEDHSILIPDLTYGYYMVYDATPLDKEGNESFVRSAVMLNSVNTNVTIELKANRPQIEKTVKKHSESYGEATSANVGDTVSFKITTLVPSHTHYSGYKYYIEDKLPAGFTLKDNSLKVQILRVGETDPVDLDVGNGYDLKDTSATGMAFCVDFSNYIDVPAQDFDIDDELIITYDAVLDKNIERDAVNVNTATLWYSNDPGDGTSIGSASNTANVYSYTFVLTKFSEDADGNFSAHVRLDGAQFQIYREDATEPMEFITETVDEGGKSYIRYVVAPLDAAAEDKTTTLEVLNTADVPQGQINNSIYLGGNKGDLTIFGLAEGTYRIVETQAPNGYNLPTKPFILTITDKVDTFGFVSDLDASIEHTGDGSFGAVGGEASTLLTWAGIANQPGNTLPSTGGMGTTVFTVLGIALMAGAIAFFTSRKRSNAA